MDRPFHLLISTRYSKEMKRSISITMVLVGFSKTAFFWHGLVQHAMGCVYIDTCLTILQCELIVLVYFPLCRKFISLASLYIYLRGLRRNFIKYCRRGTQIG